MDRNLVRHGGEGAFRELIKINVRTDTYFYGHLPGRTRRSVLGAPVHGKFPCSGARMGTLNPINEMPLSPYPLPARLPRRSVCAKAGSSRGEGDMLFWHVA